MALQCECQNLLVFNAKKSQRRMHLAVLHVASVSKYRSTVAALVGTPFLNNRPEISLRAESVETRLTLDSPAWRSYRLTIASSPGSPNNH
jgi:hypothetical protein